MQKNITIHITNDYAEMSKLAAQTFAKAATANPRGVFGFATGSTPEGMYDELVKMSKAGESNFSQITAFNLDEYVPLASTDPQSYHYYMATKLFDHVGVPLQNRNIPKGDAPCPIAECTAYEEKLNQSGGIDLQILGIGTNGHIGFNEPNETHFPAYTQHITLAQATIDANKRYFADVKDVPTTAITMGLKSIMMAKTILLLASGESKAKIMSEALYGPITPMVPATVLQLHQNVIVIADKAAAEFL